MTKRASGQGTIRARGTGFEGRYYAIRDGQRKQLSVYAPSEAEAGMKLDTALRNEAMGVIAAGPRLATATYLRDWLEARRGEVAPKTYATYRGLVEHSIIPAIGPIPLRNLSGMTVERMLRDAVAGGLSPRSAGHLRAVLRGALNRAVRYGMIERNAAADAYAPRIRNRERSFLDDAQVRLLIEGVQADPLRAFWTLAVSTGMRQGELLGLRWVNVDLVARVIRIEHQLQRIEGRLILVPPKTDAGRRTIGIPRAVAGILEALKADQDAARLLAANVWQDGGYVFTRPDGQPLYPEFIIKSWHALTDRLGLPPMTFHDLRGTAATIMNALGTSGRDIQATLGHTDFRTTMNLYTHSLPSGQREVADRMNVLFARVSGDE